MANLTVTLVKLCKTPDGWKRLPVAYGKNGRPKPGVVMVDGQEQSYPTGDYLLRYYQGRKLVYKNVGDHAGEAHIARQQQERLLAAKDLLSEHEGVTVEESTRERVSIRRALAEFIEATEANGSKVAAQVYRLSAEHFLKVTGRTYADEITAEDVTRYHKALRAEGKSDRTVHNRHTQLMAFFRHLGLDLKAIAPRKPKYEKQIPEVYSRDELSKLFAAISDEKTKITYEILLKTGLREQELMYLEWGNIDLLNGLLRVRANPRYGFKVKDGEQREIPIPADLLDKLREYRQKHPNETLVTPTTTGQPNTKLLLKLKSLAKRAGLNCDFCSGCQQRKECERWFLHKFRATYVTTLLRSGMDIRTAMKLSGHSDLASVMRYISPADNEEVKQHVAGVRWM